jgi:hypothetical protein
MLTTAPGSAGRGGANKDALFGKKEGDAVLLDTSCIKLFRAQQKIWGGRSHPRWLWVRQDLGYVDQGGGGVSRRGRRGRKRGGGEMRKRGKKEYELPGGDMILRCMLESGTYDRFFISIAYLTS